MTIASTRASHTPLLAGIARHAGRSRRAFFRPGGWVRRKTSGGSEAQSAPAPLTCLRARSAQTPNRRKPFLANNLWRGGAA